MIVHRLLGSATEFHARTIPPGMDAAEAWVLDIERTTLVLGSSQRGQVADPAATREHGVETVRRNSGGGAVLLVPGRSLWIDVLLPGTTRAGSTTSAGRRTGSASSGRTRSGRPASANR